VKSYININHLTLVGIRKNYRTSFYKGVNIIYGDSDTGKSSILEFVNYLLGASSVELADEIKASVNYAALELEINGSTFTIKRDIYDSRKLIEVYRCVFEECDKHFPKRYSPNYKIQSDDGFFSEFLLDSLNFPKIKLKVSPSRQDSELKRISFRNIYKYVYINQDDIGSKSFLGLGDWSQYTYTKEVFKYIFNVLDENISELNGEISEKTSLYNALRSKYNIVSEFLRETDYETLISLDDTINNVDLLLEQLNESLSKIDIEMTASSDGYKELKNLFNVLTLKEKECRLKVLSLQDKIDKYSRLKNDYDNDIDKIKAIQSISSRVGVVDKQIYACPICDSHINVEEAELPFEISSESDLNEELSSIVKRKRNITSLVDDLSLEYKRHLKQEKIYSDDLLKIRGLIDAESQSMITPYLTQRDALIKEISSQKKSREHLLKSLKVRNQQEELLQKQSDLEKDINDLKDRLKKLKESAPSLDKILQGLADHLNSYLREINIKNRTDIRICEKNFTPIVRGRDYFKITSGGLRTITSIGYMLSILEYSIDNDINHPRLLLLDTVGKYLGKKTKEKYYSETDGGDDVSEGISDPMKYQNIYEQLLSTAMRAEEKNEPCQIILVDNDIPETFIDRVRTYIVAHYSSTGEYGLAVGLIDDIA